MLHLAAYDGWVSMRPLTFRPIDPARDAPLVIGYVRDLLTLSFGDDAKFDRDFGQDGVRYSAWLEERLSEDPRTAVLAVWEEEAVGMVVLGRASGDPAVGYVHHYYLTPRVRGRGLGAQLDDYGCSVLAARGHDLARLSVATANQVALRFYATRGWTDAGPRPDQPGVAYMEKRLVEFAPTGRTVRS